jgi:hypothetical protein
MSSTHLTTPITDAPARPRVLLAALATSAAVGVLTVVSQGLVLSGGDTAAREAVMDELGSSAAELPSLVDLAVSEAQDTLATRAWMGIVVAAAVVGLTVAAARGGRVVRIVLAGFLGVGALLMLRSVTDVFPADAQVAGVVAVALAPLAIVLLFLPQVGRYRAARHRH